MYMILFIVGIKLYFNFFNIFIKIILIERGVCFVIDEW